MFLSRILAQLVGRRSSCSSQPTVAGRSKVRRLENRLSQQPTSLLRVRKLSSSTCLAELVVDGEGHLTSVRELVGPIMNLSNDGDLGHVMLDLSNVESISAGMLNLFSALHRRLRLQQRRLMLCGVRPECVRLLSLVNCRVPYMNLKVRPKAAVGTETWPSGWPKPRQQDPDSNKPTISA